VKRTVLYWAIILGIAGLAIAARIWSGLRDRAPFDAPAAQRVRDTLDPPRDYVMLPWVAPSEKGAGPRRIISLAPSITETICALGLFDRLVGRTQYCTYPPIVDAVPALGAMTDTNFERIRMLEPDIIFITENSGELHRTLSALQLNVVAVPHKSIEDVYTAILQIGDACSRPHTARQLVGAIKADLGRLHRVATASRPSPLRVLMAIELRIPPQNLFVAGPGSFLEELLLLTGHINAAHDVISSDFGEIPLERLREIDPDVILDFGPPRDARADAELYRIWGNVGDLQAIRNRRVRQIGGPQWLSAGPRIAIELHQMIRCLSEVR